MACAWCRNALTQTDDSTAASSNWAPGFAYAINDLAGCVGEASRLKPKSVDQLNKLGKTGRQQVQAVSASSLRR
jgi:hypothetical protein